MKIYRIILIIALSCLSLNSFAQGKANISGKVTDGTTGEALPFANVTLTVKGGTAAAPLGTTTQENGAFSFSGISDGTYLLAVLYIGFKTFTKELVVSSLNSNYDFGRIVLEAESLTLAGAGVSERRETTAASLDKKSFSLDDNLSQSGGSVLEAMKNLPGVTVTQEGKVMLRGSDQVSVLIDGKQSSLTGFGSQKGLDNIPASNVDRIEIINNPSAKYQANGMAGIINIIYKKETRTGLRGEAGFNFGLGELTTRKDNLPDIMDKYSFTPKYNPSLSLNYRTPKVNFFIQAGAMFRKKQNSNEFSTKKFTDGSNNIQSQFLENRSQQEINIKGGLDRYLSDNDQLTVYGLFDDEWHIDRGAVPYDFLSSGLRKRFWGWSEDENTWNMNYGADYSHQFSQSGHKLTASLLYKHGVEDELFPFTDENPIPAIAGGGTTTSRDSTHLISKEKIAKAKIDYVKPLAAGRFECGADLQFRTIPITYTVLPDANGTSAVLDRNLGDWSKYKENIAGLYANYIFESRLIEFEGGLRVEYSAIRYKIDPANLYYSKNEAYEKYPLFPNGRLTFKVNSGNRISLFVNRRVERPTEFDLRPFPKYDDPELLKTGNPYLRPQYTWNTEIAYKGSWESGSLFVSGYYKDIDHTISRVYTQSNENYEVVNSITQNLGSAYNLGAEVLIEQEILPVWSASAGLNWYRNKIDAFSGSLLYPSARKYDFSGRSGNTWNVKVSTTLKLKDGFDAQCSFIYYAPDIIPQGKTMERSSLDLGIRKKLLEDKMELSLTASDLLNKFALRQVIDGEDFTLTSSNYYETQVVTIGIKYKF